MQSLVIPLFAANNRTAMVTYHQLPSASATDVQLFGLDQSGLEGTLQTWLLRSANNLRGGQ